jgi:hypothetical protein
MMKYVDPVLLVQDREHWWDLRFEVFTAMTIKNAVFRDVAPCTYFVNRRFGGTCRLHLLGIRNPRTMNQREQIAVYPEDGGDTFLRNVG